MKLVIGGAFQGKRAQARRLYQISGEELVSGESCEFEELFRARAVSEFHLLIRRMMQADVDPLDYVTRIPTENPDLILISDEIGYGIVPLDPFEREWREKTGRICCMLAQEADQMIRVTAGNILYLKGAPE